jgi:hypothetical protein
MILLGVLGSQGITFKERCTPHPLKKIGALKIAILAFADLKILDSRLPDGKTIQTASHECL